MKILVDVVHPAHVHFFRHAMERWRQDGDDVLITARRKDVTLDLLQRLGLEYRVISSAARGLAGLLREKVARDFALARIVRSWGAQVLLSISGPSVAHVGWLLGIPSVVFTDTEINRLNNAMVMPFATRVFTPVWFRGDFGKHHVRYHGSHELAYVHPDRFRPDPQVLSEAGIKMGERFFLVRVVAWLAGHDVGHHGFSEAQVKELVRRLGAHGRVLISSEGTLPDDLRQHAYSLHPSKMLDLMAFAALCVGEGATMCAEAGVMGTPAVLVNHLAAGCGITRQYANAGCLALFDSVDKAWSTIDRLAADAEARKVWRHNARCFADRCQDMVQVVASSVDPFR